MLEITIPKTLLLIALGFLPSLVWLALFLTKDPRPEPKYLIIKVFLFGIIIAPLVVIMEGILSGFAELGFVSKGALFFSGAALIEEYMKYWVVKTAVISKPDFDEPHDAIIYMISAALGFAAVENVLNAFNTFPTYGLGATLGVISLRFTGATLLHALASGIVGYFLGLAWFFHGFKKQIIAFGLIFASLLHFVFNSFIFFNPETALLNNTFLLFGMLILLLLLFDKLKGRRQQFVQGLST